MSASDRPERWLTFKEASAKLHDEYGIRVHYGTLERLARYGARGGMPSAMNFGKRQVKLSEIVPWLRDHGHIDV